MVSRRSRLQHCSPHQTKSAQGSDGASDVQTATNQAVQTISLLYLLYPRETELKVFPQVSQGNQSSPLLLLIKGAAVQSPCNDDSVDILIFSKIS